MKRTRNGFTLIELLVVIAIIAILAAILFPVFAKAREKARQTTCVSNVKQMTMGIMMYKDDFDQTFPACQIGITDTFPGPDAGQWIGTAWDWQMLIYPYTKSMKISMCSSAYDGWGHSWANYGCNASIMGYDPNEWSGKWHDYVTIDGFSIKNDSAIATPAETYLIFDAGFTGMNWMSVYHPFSNHYIPGEGKLVAAGLLSNSWGGGDTSVNGNEYMNGRHNDGISMGFADGHAKWMKVDEACRAAVDAANGKKNSWDPTME